MRFKFGLSGVKRNERVRSEKGEKALSLYAGIGPQGRKFKLYLAPTLL